MGSEFVLDYKVGKMLISEEKIQEKVRELGERISRDYAGKKIVCVCVLKGAVIFLSDLIRHIDPDVEVSIDFLAISSYGVSTKSSGVVQIQKDLSTDIYQKHVLIVEDILDTGLSLKYIKSILMERKPESLAICVLLDKPDRRKEQIKVEYTGFCIPDEFAIGYGLDYDGKFRHLPALYAAEPVE